MFERQPIDKTIFKSLIESIINQLGSDPAIINKFLAENNLSVEQTKKLCLAIVKACPSAIQHIPEEILDEDVISEAVLNDYRALQYIPSYRKNVTLYTQAIKQNILALLLITEDVNLRAVVQAAESEILATIHHTENLSKEDKKNLILVIVETFPSIIRSIHEDLLDDDICIAAVSKVGSFLYDIPTTKRSKPVCIAAISGNPHLISQVPKIILDDEIALVTLSQDQRMIASLPIEKINENLCSFCANKNHESLPYIPSKFKTENFYLSAVMNNYKVLEYLPEEYHTEKFYFAALSNNYLALKWILENINDINQDFYVAAITKNPLALNLIEDDDIKKWLCTEYSDGLFWGIEKHKNMISKYEVDHLCITIIKLFPNAIHELPQSLLNKEIGIALLKNDLIQDDTLKMEIIMKITPEEILSEEYDVLKYFPKNEKLSNKVADFLANIKHVIVKKDQDKIETEFKDGYLVYMNKLKRKGKTILIDNKKLDNLLIELSNNKTKDINLVLIDHANNQTRNLAGKSIADLTNLIKNNPCITKITLFGCNTALSEKLNEEQKMIESFSSRVKHQCGFALVSIDNSLDNNFIFKILKSLKMQSAYFLTKDKNNQYKLMYIIKNDNKVDIKSYDITNDQINELLKVFNKGKSLNFPQTNDPLWYRPVITSVNKFTQKQMVAIENIVQKNVYEKFVKTHSEYKDQRDQFPFMKGFIIDVKEAQDKLNSSMLKELFVKLINRPEILEKHENFSIKGYPKILNVNTATLNEGFIISEASVYLSDYKNSKDTFFGKGKNNIDEDTLKKHRESWIENMAAGKTDGKSTAKSIEIEIKKSSK